MLAVGLYGIVLWFFINDFREGDASEIDPLERFGGKTANESEVVLESLIILQSSEAEAVCSLRMRS